MVFAVDKLLFSSSTWWVIVAQYIDLKKTQVIKYVIGDDTYSKILNSWIGFGSNWTVINYSIRSEISNICVALVTKRVTLCG